MPLQQSPPFSGSMGSPKILLPIGRKRNSGEVTAGGSARDVEPTRIAAEARRVLWTHAMARRT